MDTQSDSSETGRVEAFSDGVFAIAITLLIIEVPVPHVEGSESLADALLEQWPSYFGYVVSFITIGVMWLNHHNLFRDIARIDQQFLILNLLLLLSIAFLPFPTALLAEYLEDDEHRLEATLAYGGTFTMIAVFFNLLWLYAVRHGGLIDERANKQRLTRRTRSYLLGPLIYGATLPLAFISSWLSIAIYALLAAFYLVPNPGEGTHDHGGDAENEALQQ